MNEICTYNTKEFKTRVKQIYKLLKKMYKKQTELNDLTYPAWREKLTPSDWQCAIVDEVAEALNSIGYKWWKKQEVDFENLKVEIVDLIHFMLSKIYYFDGKNNTEDFLKIFAWSLSDDEDSANNSILPKENSEENRKYIKYKLLEMCENETERQLYVLSGLIYATANFEYYYKAYFVKNFLNEFRQKNGYKDGTYKKIWKVDIGSGLKEYEDNEVVFAIANKIPLEEIDRKLYNEIENIMSLKMR